MSADQAPRYLEPTPRGRALALLSLVATAAFMGSHYLWVPGVVARFDERNPCASMGELQLAAAYFLLLACVPSLYAGWQAWRVHRAGQCPPPSAWVLFRTRVHTGRGFRVQRALLAVAAVGLLSLPAWLLLRSDLASVFGVASC